jgi:HK97 family phage major capsid protein/HK97 family phage prohead protease
MEVVRKLSAAAEVDASDEYVLSDETVDRYGDVIKLSAWKLANFKRNPIVLFNHDNNFPIGRWENIGVRNGGLRAKFVPAAPGTSARIDEINSLRAQGILKATSVGFKPLKAEPRKDGRGLDYTEAELLETSIVSVPANPNALQVAKSLNISDDTMDLVFGKQAITREALVMGKHAPSLNQSSKGAKPMKLSERIEAAQERLLATQDQLRSHLENIGEEPDEAAHAATEELTGRIAEEQRSLDNLQKAERSLVTTATPISEEGPRKPFAVPAKKVEPVDYVFRSLAVAVRAHGDKKPLLETMKSMYGEDVATKSVMDVVLRASSAPATTTTSGWADSLVATAISDFIDLLMPQSVYPSLSAKGGRFSFGRNGIVSLPARTATPTVAGSFVAQGAPIPVRQAAFSSVSLTPKKMAVITTMTREIMEHSTPSIEQILRQAIQEDTSVAIDTVLLDATAASTTRPAGLRNGVTTTTATSGGGFAALVGDIKNLLGALITSTNGNLRAPTWIMNPVQAISIALTQNAGGDFPFKQEVNQNQLQGYPVITSSTVPAGYLILVDAADFFSATGDDPRFDISDQATLHMEDTTPLAIGTAGSPNTVAAPVRSLWQTDTVGLRMILDMNWAMRRTGAVAWTSSVTW